MSKFLLLALILMIGCKAQEQKTPDSVGNIKKYEPIEISEADYKKVHAICIALAAKEDILNILITTANNYNFLYAQKNCDDKIMPAMENVVTTLQGFDPYYTFQPKNGALFGFPNVETTSNGIMVDICEAVMRGGDIKSPMTTRTGAIWFTTNTSAEHCKQDGSAYCIHIQRGTAVSTYDYKIHTNEWMKVQVAGPHRGFFTERKLISSANCGNKETFQKKAVLK